QRYRYSREPQFFSRALLLANVLRLRTAAVRFGCDIAALRSFASVRFHWTTSSKDARKSAQSQPGKADYLRNDPPIAGRYSPAITEGVCHAAPRRRIEHRLYRGL